MEILCLGLAAAVLIGVAVIPTRFVNIPIGVRFVSGIVGLVCGFLLLLFLFALMLSIKAGYYQEVEAVKLAQIKAMQGLSDRAVDFLDTHDIRVEMRPQPKGIKVVWAAPGMDFEEEDIIFWVKETLKTYPNLPTQHGLTGWEGEEKGYRDELKAFTSMVCGAGLASYPSGNQPAKWLVKAHDIPGLLGVNL